MIQRADGRVVLLCLRLAVVAAIAAGSLRAQSSPATTPSPEAPATLRFHGLIEPIRSYTVVAPRLTGSGPTPGVPFGQLVIVRLARAGTMVKKGDLLVEFDRNAQLKAAHDRESEYRDFLEQLNRKRGELITAKARRPRAWRS